MKKITIVIIIICSLFMISCSKTEKKSSSEKENYQTKKVHTIIANGYGESKEKAVEDAKNDALRQFGFKVSSDSSGKPELLYAGRIVNVKIIKDYFEELQNGMWWEIKVEAEIEKL